MVTQQKRRRFTSPLRILPASGIFLVLAGCTSADSNPAPRIDGKLEAAEWRSAEVHAFPEGGTIRLRRIGNDLYIAVSAVEPGFPTIFIGSPDAVEVLHASAAQASVRYFRAGHAWMPAQPAFEYALRQGSDGRQAPQAARDAFLKTHKWLSTSDRSHHGTDREFLVRLGSGRRFLAISFLGMPSMNTHAWPAGATDGTRNLRLLQGEVPPGLEFSPGSWWPVGEQPGDSFKPKPLRGPA